MWRYNKYDIGEIVSCRDMQMKEFMIVDILHGEPERKGHYLYRCKLLCDREFQFGGAYQFHENHIRLIRKASIDDFNAFLEKALDEIDERRMVR